MLCIMHMWFIRKRREYGDLIIGLFTDEAISTFKRLPYLNYEQRKILLNFKGVKKLYLNQFTIIQLI